MYLFQLRQYQVHYSFVKQSIISCIDFRQCKCAFVLLLRDVSSTMGIECSCIDILEEESSFSCMDDVSDITDRWVPLLRILLDLHRIISSLLKPSSSPESRCKANNRLRMEYFLGCDSSMFSEFRTFSASSNANSALGTFPKAQ
mmetsp:Transcript_30133/g.46102  ORF Transcript_30133/g.46102 Transcript_30133/m.46102 type:complete len:144 (-) Transcript_30133:389-820(-)